MPKDVIDSITGSLVEGIALSSENVAVLQNLYSPQYLQDCASDEAREERLAELKRRVEARAYQIDPDRIAEELLLRGDLG